MAVNDARLSVRSASILCPFLRAVEVDSSVRLAVVQVQPDAVWPAVVAVHEQNALLCILQYLQRILVGKLLLEPSHCPEHLFNPLMNHCGHSLLRPEYPSVPTGGRLRRFAVDVADSAVPDALPFALDAEFLQQLLEFRHLELFLGAVNPDASQSQ